MSYIVTKECFKGFHHLSKMCVDGNRLQLFIERYEQEYLIKLLGCDLTALLLTDLVDGVPQDPEYLEFFNPFCSDSVNSCCSHVVYDSKGLKDMLTGFIYYHFVHNSHAMQSQTGLAVPTSQAGEKVSYVNNEADADQRYNEAVQTFNAISAKLGNCNKMSVKAWDFI